MRPTVLLAVLLMGACSPQAAHPSPTATKPTSSPSVAATLTPTPTPTQSGPTPLTLSAIQRLTPSVGYVAAWIGTGPGLAKTSDGGATWQRLSIPASFLTALRFIDERVGWAAGFVDRDVAQTPCWQAVPANVQPCKGVVLRTEDGGNTWQTVLAIPTEGLQGEIQQIQAVDGQRAWALTPDPSPCQFACPSYLQRTTDGGRTWTTLLHDQIGAIRFASATRGWAALNNTPTSGTVEVRETSDGGTSWVTVLHTSTGAVFGLDAATINTAWLLTGDSAYCSSSSCSKYALFRTSDGGRNWSSLGNPLDFARCSIGHLVGPLFASTGRGWLGLNLGAGGANAPGGIMKSEDGGRTWQCAITPPNAGFISAADPFHVWAGGENRSNFSTALYTTEDAGATWHPLNLSSLQAP